MMALAQNPENSIALTDLDAASFIVAHGHPLQRIEKQATGLTVFKFKADTAPLLASFYSGGLVSGQAMGIALRQLKKTLHQYEDNSYDRARRQSR